MHQPRPVRFRFGSFEADLPTGELYHYGKKIAIQDKPFLFLVVLLQSGGKVVTREEISRRLWPDTHVQVDQGLNAAARKVRRALDDDAATPKYIETLGSRGYRFISPIEIIRWSSNPPPDEAGRIRIAVLPLENLAEVDEAVANSITAQLIAQLGRSKAHLRIIKAASVQPGKSFVDFHRELDAQYLVSTTLTWAARRFRLSVMLLHAEDQRCLWSETYERPAEELLAIQAHVAKHIARSLQKPLSSPSTASQPSGAQFSVSESYLRGRYFWNKRTPAALRKSMEYFHHAIAQDANYALAHAGLADAYNMLASQGLVLPKEGFALARQSAMRALELEPDLPEAHVALAWARLSLDYEWEPARRGFERAIELNPGYAFAYNGYAYVLLASGATEKAVEAVLRGRELDPLSLPMNALLSTTYYYADRFDDARRQAELAIELDPNFPISHICLGQAYLALGHFSEAIPEFEHAAAVSEQSPLMVAHLAHGLAAAGRQERALAILDELSDPTASRIPPAYHVSLVHLALGNKERALEWLERACDERVMWTLLVRVDPRTDALRHEPQFASICKLLKFPDLPGEP